MSAELAIAAERSMSEFLRSSYFQAVVTEAVDKSLLAGRSPWLDRKGAAVHCRCSVSEISRAAAAGIIKQFMRGMTPVYSKTDLNTAIASGRWRIERAP